MFKQVESVSITQRYWNVIRNGLFLWGIRNRLALIGFDIKPYYWVQEETEECKEPKIKGDCSEYSVRYLNYDEVYLIASNVTNNYGKDLIKGFNNGQLCIGLEYENEIAAYSFIELNDFSFNHRIFKLKNNEAYLLNMWTFNSHRGKNLAPYLRYHCYQLLKEKGVDVKYSITEYFNKSSIKFKKKLNSKHLNLFLSIVLFKKYHWNFMLKKY
jgi:hypothetical protein